jgi:acetoin utilization protein AcuB
MTTALHVIGAGESLRAARELIEERQVGHLPVLLGAELVGLLTEREVRSFEALPGSGFLTVEETMVPDAYVTSPDALLEGVATEMASRRLSSALVVEGDAVVGVFTVNDALRALADALRSRRPAAEA